MTDADVDPIRVVHVDDDPEIVELASTFLQREDDRLRIEAATTAEEALERVATGDVDCVISDFQLPDTDCETFLSRVHEQEPGLPFVLFTGRDRAQLSTTFLDGGVTAHLQKGSGTDQYSELADEIVTAVEDRRNVQPDGGRFGEEGFRGGSGAGTDDARSDSGDDHADSTGDGGHRPRLDDLDGDLGTVVSAALDAVEDGFFVLDRDLELRYWNRRIPAVTGYSDAEIGQMEPADLFVASDRAAVEEAIAEVARTGTGTVETRVETAAGESFPVEFRGSRLTDGDGEVLGYAGVTRDVSERRAYERELERQNERLEELVGAVSHDLRNPLNVIAGRIELARELGDEEHFEAIERSTDRMETLIADLVTLARDGKTVSEPDREPVKLTGLAENAWNGIDTADATLSIETRQQVLADPDRLLCLLENLFANSVDHGGPAVEVCLGELDGGFFVADDGPGIPPADREEIFEYGTASIDGGTGIGLAIVRRIAEAHDWSVSATESETAGARIEVTGVERTGVAGLGRD